MNHPMLDKMQAVSEDSQTIGEFLDWLGEQGGIICRYGCPHGHAAPLGEEADDHNCRQCTQTNVLWPLRLGIESMLALYFDIDLKQAEREKQAILDSIRA